MRHGSNGESGLSAVQRTPPTALTTTRKDLVMADRKLTLPMTIDEIRALADRLEARGTSVLMKDQPAQCADLERAAHLLRLPAAPAHSRPPAAASKPDPD